MIGLKTFRVWNYQINQWTEGFVHYSLPKNDLIRESTNLDILGPVLVLKSRSEYCEHKAPQFKNWLDQVKMREVSELSPEYNNWLSLHN